MKMSIKSCLALAVTSLFSLICASPSHAGALADYNNGTAYFQMGKLNEAIRWFDKSIAYREKGFAEPYINKGFCLQKLGYHDRAVLCYNEAIKVNPKVAVAYQNRGTAYLHLNRYAESLRDLNQAISMPRQASLSIVTVYIDRGRAYAGLHRWKESFADFDYVMSMQTTNPKMEKLKLAAADEKRRAQALMAQVGTGTTKPSTVNATTHSTIKTPDAPSSSLPATSSSPSPAKTDLLSAPGDSISRPTEAGENDSSSSKTTPPAPTPSTTTTPAGSSDSQSR
jgi:tetratricopeptide (TPR) repeat protein